MNAQLQPERLPADVEALRIPPHAIDAEQAVLGGLMLTPQALAKIADWFTEDDFYRRDHRLIFRAINELANRPGAACDAVTMGDWFDTNGIADLIGGSAYLVELANNTASASNIVAYAEIVAEKSRLRRAIDVGTRLTEAAWMRGAESGLVASDAMQAISKLQATQQRGGLKAAKSMLSRWFQDLTERYQRGDAVMGMPTPWHRLDELTHGFQPGELIVIAARPNMGKSVMGGQLAAATAMRGIRTAMFSLEMTEKQVMRRAVACFGGIDHDWLMQPVDDDTAWHRVSNAVAMLNDAPLLVDDTPALSLLQLQARARRAHLQSPIGLIVVDHLHEMAIDDPKQEASAIGRNVQGLKTLGKEFNCPVVVLAQLNRALKDRSDKRPTMTDLRGSGDIEQKADVVLFLHREDYHDPKTHLRGIVEVSIGKGRDIKTGERVYLRNRYDQMRLDDYDDLLPEPEPEQPSRPRGFPARHQKTTEAWWNKGDR